LLSGCFERSGGNPVARSECASVFVSLTRHGSPLRNAPLPRAPHHSMPTTGATTAPASGPSASTAPLLTQNIGCPWTKFIVPSSGSQYHVTLPAAPPPSSP